jgi:hypothetical protein
MADVTLKLTIGTFSVEVSGPSDYADKKLEELVGRYLTSSGKTAMADSSMPGPAADKGGKQMSAAEFIKKANVKNQIDRGIALAYYLEHKRSQSNFTSSEIGDLGRETKYPFTNISDNVARLVARGLMMSAGEKDGQRAYALTASGEEYVDSMLTSS